jgi:16S rRNA (uracil1498-N3)-methyltransferase
MARRIRVNIGELRAGQRALDREQAHYVGVVHRLAVGDVFIAFDPEHALESDATITRSERGRIECELSEPRAAERRSLGITLLQGASKGDRLEQVVRAGTALGVARVVVVTSERSVASPSDMRRERLRSIALEAARQSGRGDLPEISGPTPLESALGALEPTPTLRLVLAPTSREPLAARIHDWTPEGSVALLVGPEGGLAPSELALAERSGFLDASLGPFTLRTELAAIAALACFVGKLPSS